MNCFSTFSGMRETSNFVNSLTNRFAKTLTFEFSGANFTDLSATSSYAISAAALNPNKNDISNSFAIVKHNNIPLFVSDFSSGSFTFYLKHASNTSPLPPFNFLNPNMVKSSATYISINQDFSAQFYSFLSPGTNIPYSITGCVSSDLSGAPLIGTFTAPFQEITYRVTAPLTSSISFNMSGGLTTSIVYTNVVYKVTVSEGVYWLATGGAAPLPKPSITLGAGLRYLFDQSDQSNIGNTLVLGQTRDSEPYYTTGVVINSTAGSPNAYTLIDLSGQTLPSPALKYFSRNTAGMGPFTVPGTPTITNAIAGNTFADIYFSAPANNGGSPITLYTVTVATLSGGNYTPLGTVFNGTSLLIRTTGLTNGATYYFSVYATNVVGSGTATSYANSSLTIPLPATAPGVPRNVRNVSPYLDGNQGARYMVVYWDAPLSDGGATITEYRMQISRYTSFSPLNTDIAVISPEINDPNNFYAGPGYALASGTRYYYRVTAKNSVGTTPSSVGSYVVPYV